MAGAGALWIVIWFVLCRLERTAEKAGRQPQTTDSRDILAGGVLFMLIVAFFWRTASGDVFQPADGGDLVSFLFPTYRFAARELGQGVLPLWNPHLYGGAPFISDIQAGFLYPPNLMLFLLVPDFPYATMQWLVTGHLYWAGLGLYVLLRVLIPGGETVARPAALFGALAFALCDALFIHLGNLNLIAVLSWMPWVFTAYVLALHRRSLRWAAVAAALFAFGSYAGHPQSNYYIGSALGVYALTRTIGDWAMGNRELEHVVGSPEKSVGSQTEQAAPPISVRSSIVSGLRPIFYLLLIAILVILLTAPILLPALEMTQFTERSDFTYQDTIAFSLAPTQALVGMLTPGFFGRGPALHWSLWDRVETPFVGISTLLMAFGAFFWAQAHVRRDLWPWLALALFGLLTSFGVYAIVHGWLTLLLPGFDQFRAPARANRLVGIRHVGIGWHRLGSGGAGL